MSLQCDGTQEKHLPQSAHSTRCTAGDGTNSMAVGFFEIEYKEKNYPDDEGKALSN